jgi:anaerobic selenocysteine-containing dehydrogenase
MAPTVAGDATVSRRGFFKLSGAAMAGTAVGGLAALGADLAPKAALAQELRIEGARTHPSVCPYCAVGCGTLVHTVDGRIVNVEGNPESPVNYGNLCPKGAATMYPGSLADADCVVVECSNMAECHPVAFRWVTQAKLKGARLIHVDPRFTRTSAMADLYAPVRTGSDIAFLGGLRARPRPRTPEQGPLTR